MPNLWLLSGPCGAGKTTLSVRLAEHLSRQQGGRQVCLLHGDDFHRALVGDERSAAGHALSRNVDVVLDYIVEEELPLIRRLAARHGASLRYAVLTAPEDMLHQRLTLRGDAKLIPRALFLREKLQAMPENQGRLVDASDGDAALAAILALPELLHCDIDNPNGNGVS